MFVRIEFPALSNFFIIKSLELSMKIFSYTKEKY